MAFISHGAQVGALQRAAVLHGPRVCPAPAVHGALDFCARKVYAVDAAEHLKGAGAAEKAEGQLLHLAHLALLGADLGVRHTKGGRGIDFVRVKP